MSKRAIIILFAVFYIIFIFGCASSKVDKNVKTDLNDLQKQIFELQQDQAYMNTKIEQVLSEINPIYNRLESQENKINEVFRKQNAVNNNLIHQPARSLQAEEKGFYDTALDESNDIISQSPRMLYEKALNLINTGNIDPAIPFLQKYLELYPYTELADNAIYWLGECYYKKLDYYKAIQEFKRILIDYPKGNKVTSALLKLGYTYYELDQMSQALESLQRIIKLYPDDSTYPLAQKKINQILHERGFNEK